MIFKTIKTAIKNPALTMPIVFLGMDEIGQDLPTERHFNNLGEILKENYSKNRGDGDSKLISTLKAGYDSLSYDLNITTLKWLKKTVDFFGGYKIPITRLTAISDCDEVKTARIIEKSGILIMEGNKNRFGRMADIENYHNLDHLLNSVSRGSNILVVEDSPKYGNNIAQGVFSKPFVNRT